jgi:hypothetical protein
MTDTIQRDGRVFHKYEDSDDNFSHFNSPQIWRSTPIQDYRRPTKAAEQPFKDFAG